MPNTLESLGRAVIQVPPVTSSITPRNAYSMPSVTIMEGMRPSVTRVPLIAPHRAPTATAASSGNTNPPTLVATAPPATPDGPCEGSDVVATPSVKGGAHAGRPVVFTLSLTTRESDACTFDVSASSLALKITSGDDRIWSTQDCRGAVPKQSVVVRKAAPTTVAVGWSSQRSDADCTRSTDWARPGYYHVTAAAYGADPVDEQFELGPAVRPTVTVTPTPEGSPTPDATTEPEATPAAKKTR